MGNRTCDEARLYEPTWTGSVAQAEQRVTATRQPCSSCMKLPRATLPTWFCHSSTNCPQHLGAIGVSRGTFHSEFRWTM